MVLRVPKRSRGDTLFIGPRTVPPSPISFDFLRPIDTAKARAVTINWFGISELVT